MEYKKINNINKNYLKLFLENNFLKSKPFSFCYNGTNVVSEFGDLIKKEGEQNENYELYESKMAQIDECLDAVLKVKIYEEYSAVEWWLELENIGNYDSNIISKINYCDIGIKPNIKPEAPNWEWPMLAYSRGSQARKDDFMMTKMQFWPDPGQTCEFECIYGRSSSEYMPYFNIQTSSSAGVILAIGWSGTWKAQIRIKPHCPERTVLSKISFPDAYFRLHPKEKIILPTMLAMPWEYSCYKTSYEFIEKDCIGAEKAFDRSHNDFRRLIYDNMLPKINNKPIEGKICLRAWGGFKKEQHERKIENIKKHNLKGESYAIDAGWYGEDWHQDAGDWEPLPELFPNGLKGLADLAKEANLEFSAWFELERAGTTSKSVAEHREYYLGHTFKRGGYIPMENYVNMWYGLLVNFGYEPARQWIKNKVIDTIKSCDMKIFRIDYNVWPADFWHYSDTCDRKGLTEIKYMNGLYKTFDELLELFPDLIIDNCAGGGRRLDYAMGKRSIPIMCRSDYFTAKDYKPEGIQAHTYALSSWLPVHSDSAGSCMAHSALCMDTYKFRSSICSGIGVPVPEWELSEEEAAWYRKMLNDAFRLRPYMCKDFYPLTGYNFSLKDWLAYRFHDYDTGNGVIFAFRREESCAERYVFELTEGIDPNRYYTIEDIDEGIMQSVLGSQLIEGIPFHITEKRKCRIVFYNLEKED